MARTPIGEQNRLKSESRNPKSETNPKLEPGDTKTRRTAVSNFSPLSGFEFVSYFDIRDSNLPPSLRHHMLRQRISLRHRRTIQSEKAIPML
jgi:hypothetical protein